MDAYIGGIGGGQFYVNKKIELLQKDGWEVLIISGCTSPIILPNIKTAHLLLIPDIRCYLREIFKRKREKIINSIINEISDFKEAIIESNALSSAEWGELLACRLCCKHIIYSLSEINKIYSPFYYNFYNFKLQRREIAGIKQESLKKLFSDYRVLSDEESYFLLAYGSLDAVEYFVSDVENIERADINIGIVARIDKPFVDVAINDVIDFANKNAKYKINLLILGRQPGRHDGLSELIKNRVKKNASNIKLYIFEMMTPIPKSFYRKLDVVISSSGCASISASVGVPTIAMDSNDYKPIGILGYTTLQSIFREKQCECTTIELLEQILFQDFCKGKTCMIKRVFNSESEERYQKQVKFINASEQKKEYFDLSHPHRKFFDLKCLIIRCFGIRLLRNLKAYLYLHEHSHLW